MESIPVQDSEVDILRNTGLLFSFNETDGNWFLPNCSNISAYNKLYNFFIENNFHISKYSSCGYILEDSLILNAITELFNHKAEFITIVLKSKEEFSDEINLKKILELKKKELESVLFLILDFPNSEKWLEDALENQYNNLIIQSSINSRIDEYIETWIKIQNREIKDLSLLRNMSKYYSECEDIKLKRYFPVPTKNLLLLGTNILIKYKATEPFNNRGSIGHPDKCKKPCNKFRIDKPNSCKHGNNCDFCHCEHNRPSQKSQCARFVDLRKWYEINNNSMKKEEKELYQPIYTTVRDIIYGAYLSILKYKNTDPKLYSYYYLKLCDYIRMLGEEVQLERPVSLPLMNKNLPRIVEPIKYTEAEMNEKIKWYQGVLHTSLKISISSNCYSFDELKKKYHKYLNCEINLITEQLIEVYENINNWVKRLETVRDKDGLTPSWFIVKIKSLIDAIIDSNISDKTTEHDLILLSKDNLNKLIDIIPTISLDQIKENLESCTNLYHFINLFNISDRSLDLLIKFKLESYLSPYVIIYSWGVSRKNIADYLLKFVFNDFSLIQDKTYNDHALYILFIIENNLTYDCSRGNMLNVFIEEEELIDIVFISLKERINNLIKLKGSPDLIDIINELHEEFAIKDQPFKQFDLKIFFNEKCQWIEPLLLTLVEKEFDKIENKLKEEQLAIHKLFGEVLLNYKFLHIKLFKFYAAERGQPIKRSIFDDIHKNLLEKTSLNELNTHLKLLMNIALPPGLIDE